MKLRLKHLGLEGRTARSASANLRGTWGPTLRVVKNVVYTLQCGFVSNSLQRQDNPGAPSHKTLSPMCIAHRAKGTAGAGCLSIAIASSRLTAFLVPGNSCHSWRSAQNLKLSSMNLSTNGLRRSSGMCTHLRQMAGNIPSAHVAQIGQWPAAMLFAAPRTALWPTQILHRCCRSRDNHRIQA